jgi:integrase
MGSIIARKRKDGTTGYRVQIVVKRQGNTHQEARTFDRKQAATAWMVRREQELSKPGGLVNVVEDPKLADVIDRFLAESRRPAGRTKTQVLGRIKTAKIAAMKCSEIGTTDIIDFVQSLEVSPQTAQNYLSHLSAIFSIARPAWGYPLDIQAMKDAFVVAKRLGSIAKSSYRNRRPSLDELNRLMERFASRGIHRDNVLPMHLIMPFAIFSTRRREEIVNLRWSDYERDRILVRAMKHPGDKAGNDTWVDLIPEASAFINAMPRERDVIFPFSPNSVGVAFSRACQVLGIEDLHFHDLRHEGVSRLFEMGWNIPRVASVSGHRTWQSLQRYTHLRQTGDKFAAWKWRAPLGDAA